MFIIPFLYHIKKENNIHVISIQLLTIGGMELWKEDDSMDLDRDILEVNDLHRTGDLIVWNKDIMFCEMDLQKTKIDDFYQWSELSREDRDTFCWRTYYYFKGEKEESWLSIPSHEMLGNQSVRTLLEYLVENKKQK